MSKRTNWRAMYEEAQRSLDGTRAENAQLRKLNAEWATDSARLKRELLKAKSGLSAAVANTAARAHGAVARRDAAIRYCREHNVASVSDAVLDEVMRHAP